MAMPNIKEFMDATGVDFRTASDILYGNVGANLDTRDWGAIMSSDNIAQAATDALAAMYSDPAYQAQNLSNLTSQGYDPAQAYYTYGQMNDRVGANYVPSQSEIAAVENYFNANVEPGFKWDVPQPGGGGAIASATTSAPATTSTPKRAVAAAQATGGLTPEIARDLIQRSMTTGVPTSEFDKYGGYQNVKSFYSQNGGTYSLDDLSPEFLNSVDDVIANTGVGNLSVLKKTGTPLTQAGYNNMINNGVTVSVDQLQAQGIPFSRPQTSTQPGNMGTGGASGGSGGSGGSGTVMGSMLPNSGSGWDGRQVVGASDGRLMGAGNADYNSSLIKSLRQSSLTPFSNNAGIQMLPNQGMATSNWTPPSGSDAAFSPSILSPRLATDQEVTDWNAYQTYKTNSVGAKTPILSMDEWIAKGRSDGKPVAQTPVYDPYFVPEGA